MRISDWSSDVCSSDLIVERRQKPAQKFIRGNGVGPVDDLDERSVEINEQARAIEKRRGWTRKDARIGTDRHQRSEEHTSELQSLMRISYAVFCLKKKKSNKHYIFSREKNIRLQLTSLILITVLSLALMLCWTS